MPFFPPLLRSDRLEILDVRDATDEEIEANFAEIALVNRYLGGASAMWNALNALCRAVPDADQARLQILDVATGCADIPRALVRRTRRDGDRCRLRFQITATEISPAILGYASSLTAASDYPEISLEAADALSLPFTDRAYDVAICSMALHHFTPSQASELLREMSRVSRVGFIINDLRRDRFAYVLIRILTLLFSASAITRHDAPLSVLRAYTIREIADIAGSAELGMHFQIYAAPAFRAVLIARHHSPNGER